MGRGLEDLYDYRESFMAAMLKIGFASPALEKTGTLVLFVGSDLELSAATRKLIGTAGVGTIKRAISAEKFKGKERSTLLIPAPQGFDVDRVVVVGLGKDEEQEKADYVRLGGVIASVLGSASTASILLEGPAKWRADAEAAADIALGLRLRHYRFDKYKAKKRDAGDGEKADQPISVTIHVEDPVAAKRLVRSREAVGSGVEIARDLVNEPPNVLDPIEFAKRAKELEKLGVDITILDEKQLAHIGMRALLGVGQGSEKESRVVIMRWNGAKAKKGTKAQPVAFIGKGVVFDTGGISIKPAQGMEDMKGDMAGAACVVGLMHALAARKAKVNAIGAIGLVENMPDGNAQRPGDIVTSLSGQTIEIINTDAEGRLVLGDVLWYVKETYKPSFMIDLATLTGAIMIALGQEYAGLFSNNDTLAERLHAAGQATGEGVWRMPLGAAYDKMIDSKFADMKNTGGRFGGSITAAQFLKRFVGDTPWAHLDIAGTAMSSPETDINKSWASGWGVRLLDRLVADYYEERD
jgi:leucyl aminopeptidase